MVNITTPLTILGAALPRSGTTSLMTALEHLGYKVFHGSLFFQPSFRMKYASLFYEMADADENGNRTQYKQALDAVVEELSADGYTAILDQPGCWIYQELMEYYPNAKVIHTIRDRNEWSKSMVEMAFSLDVLSWQPPFSLRPNAYRGRAIGRWAKRQLGIRKEEVYEAGVPFNGTNVKEHESSVSYETCAHAYDRYHKKVRNTVPPEKLIEYNVKDGWAPLCQHFLPENMPCPTKPFPHANSKDAGFLLDWKIKLKIKIALYKLHPMLVQDWLVSVIMWTQKNWRAMISALLSAFGLSYVLLKDKRYQS